MKLREFDSEDWNDYAGAEYFKDGTLPLIGSFEEGNPFDTILLDKVALCLGIGSEKWYELKCTKKMGILIIENLSDDVSEKEIIELGFIDVMN